MRPLLFSGDIEASGPVTPTYSMISVGYCLADDTRVTFYAELAPISDKYVEAAMRIGCRGLACVREHAGDPRFDPHGDLFDPAAVLAELERTAERPIDAILRLAQWVSSVSSRREGAPTALYAPSSFESGFLPYYFDTFNNGVNPFGHSAWDAESYLRGATGNDSASLSGLGQRPTDGLMHHALDDAIAQANEFHIARKIANENRIRHGLYRR